MGSSTNFISKFLLLALALSCTAVIRADPPASAPSGAAFPASDDGKYGTADALWQHITDLRAALSDGLHRRDMAAMRATAPQLLAAMNRFFTTYPKDPRYWAAKLGYADVGVFAGQLQLPEGLPPEQAEKIMDDVATNQAAPKDVRAEAVMGSTVMLLKNNTPKDRDAADARIVQFQKEFGDYAPDGQHGIVLILRELELRQFKTADPARYESLLQMLVKDPQPAIAAMAQQELAQDAKAQEVKTKPLPLQFTAVDGKQIDLAAMRGKVVLIDFWATWCGPCREEVPNVVATYQKFHPQGFEIVGISLDQDKNALLSYTKQNGMVWPQYFDGKGWDNTISKGFGIDSIPAMWLVDKKGMLVTTNGRDDLAGQVEKLLKTPPAP